MLKIKFVWYCGGRFRIEWVRWREA